jgi:hypothetical protein
MIQQQNNDFSFEILKNFGTLSQSNVGWTKELNLVSWNGRPAKFDIREWSPDKEKMRKGVTFDQVEAKKLSACLSGALC